MILKLELKEIEFTLERNKSSLTNTSEAQEYLNTLTERHFEILKLDLEILKATNDNEQERLEVLEKQKISVTEFYTTKLQKMQEEHNLLKSNLDLEMKIGMAQSGGGSDSETVQGFISLSQALNKIQIQRDKLNQTTQRTLELEQQKKEADANLQATGVNLAQEQDNLLRKEQLSNKNFLKEREEFQKRKEEQIKQLANKTGLTASTLLNYMDGSDTSEAAFKEIDAALQKYSFDVNNYNLLIAESLKIEEQINESVENQKSKVKDITDLQDKQKETLESINNEIKSSNLSQEIQAKELANYHQELKNSTVTLEHQADQLEFQLTSIEKMKTSMEALNLSINSGTEAYEKQRKNIELNIKEKENELAVERSSIKNAADHLKITINMNDIQNNIKEITKKIKEGEEESNNLSKQNLVAAMKRYLANVNLSEELIKQMEISILNLDIERRSTVIREENSRKLAISNKEVEDSLSVQIASQKLLDDTEHNRLRTMELTHRKNIEIQEAQLKNIKGNLEEGKKAFQELDRQNFVTDGRIDYTKIEGIEREDEKYKKIMTLAATAYNAIEEIAIEHDIKLKEMSIENAKDLFDIEVDLFERAELKKRHEIDITNKKNEDSIELLELELKLGKKFSEGKQKDSEQLEILINKQNRQLEIEKEILNNLIESDGILSDTVSKQIQSLQHLSRENDLQRNILELQLKRNEQERIYNNLLDESSNFLKMSDLERRTQLTRQRMTPGGMIPNPLQEYSNINAELIRAEMERSLQHSIINDRYKNDEETRAKEILKINNEFNIKRSELALQVEQQDLENFEKVKDNITTLLEDKINNHFEAAEAEKELNREKNEAIAEMERDLYRELRDIQEDYTLTFNERMNKLESLARDSSERRSEIEKEADEKKEEFDTNNLFSRERLVNYGSSVGGSLIASASMPLIRSLTRPTVEANSEGLDGRLGKNFLSNTDFTNMGSISSIFKNLFLGNVEQAENITINELLEENTKAIVDNTQALLIETNNQRGYKQAENYIFDKLRGGLLSYGSADNAGSGEVDNSGKFSLPSLTNVFKDVGASYIFSGLGGNVTRPVLNTLWEDISKDISVPETIFKSLFKLLTPFDNPTNDNKLMTQYKQLGSEMQKAQERSAADMIGISAGAFTEAYAQAASNSGQGGVPNVTISGEFRLDQGAIRFFEDERNRLSKRGNI